MPGVLMLESLSQVAAILLLQREDAPPNARVYLRGVNDAKFRRQVVPGDRLRLEITLGRRRASLARAQAAAYVGDQVVAECRAAARAGAGSHRDRSDARSSTRGAQIGEGTTIGPHATIGAARQDRRELPDRRVGGHRRLDRDRRRHRDLSVRVDRPDPAGPEVPRRGDAARHRPAQHLPRVRDHPPRHARRRRRDRRSATATCSWPTCTSRTTATSATTRSSATWRRSAATSRSRTSRTSAPAPASTSSAGSAGTRSSAATRSSRRTRCRSRRPSATGRRASTASTPSASMRRGFSPEVIAKLKRSFRYLLQSKLNTTPRAASRSSAIRRSPAPRCSICVDFIRTSQRGVILRRARRAEEVLADE